MPQGITVVMEHPEWGDAYVYEQWHQQRGSGAWILLPVMAEFSIFCPKEEQTRCLEILVEARARQLGCEVDWVEVSAPASTQGLPVPAEGRLVLGAKITPNDKVNGKTALVIRGAGWSGRETGTAPASPGAS